MIESQELIHIGPSRLTLQKINNKRLAMNRSLFVILSFAVSTLAALAVSGALHAQALNPPARSCVVHFDTPRSACDSADSADGADGADGAATRAAN